MVRSMLKLEPPDSHHLLAAPGWIDLGNHPEADAELDKFAPLLRVHPDVLRIRWHIYGAAKKWEAAAHIATALKDRAPDDPTSWTQTAYALRRSKDLEVALDTLVAAERLFPKSEII
jgi:tetratricopeptide (TPR) repeat protein